MELLPLLMMWRQIGLNLINYRLKLLSLEGGELP